MQYRGVLAPRMSYQQIPELVTSHIYLHLSLLIGRSLNCPDKRRTQDKERSFFEFGKLNLTCNLLAARKGGDPPVRKIRWKEGCHCQEQR